MSEYEYMQRPKGKAEPEQKRESEESRARQLLDQAEWIRREQEKEAAQAAKWNALTPEEREAELARRDQERQKYEARQQEQRARYEAEAPARRAQEEKRKAEQEAHAEAQRRDIQAFQEGQRLERQAKESAEREQKAATQAAQHAKDVEELSHYEHDHEKQPGTAARARLLSSPDAARLSAADTKAHEKRIAEAAALEHAQAANRQAAHQLVANFRAAIAQAIPSIETAAREARLAHKLTPDGTREILVEVGEVVTQALMSNVEDAGIKAAIRVVCARIERGETVDVLRANLESVAARLDPVLTDKAHGKSGEVFGAIPEAAELAHQLAHAGHAALAKATGSNSHGVETTSAGGAKHQDRGVAGRQLDPTTRRKMETAYGESFADVTIHQDSEKASGSTHALAEGSDVHFAPGKYAPGTENGDRLIAHELAHVVQQRSAAPSTAQAFDPSAERGLLEHDADQAATHAVNGQSSRVQFQATPGMRQRFDSYEHQKLGDAGGKNIRLKCDVWLTYGQAVALAGDFYGTPEALMNAPREEVVRILDRIDVEKQQAVRNQAAHSGDPGFAKPTDREGMANEIEFESATAKREDTVYDRQHQGVGKAGEMNGRGEAHSYSALADKNEDHFSDENAKRWKNEHAVALEIAKHAHENCLQSKAKLDSERMNEAYLHDAFSCHFLTDAFSSGHLISGTTGRDIGELFWNNHEAEIVKALLKAANDDPGGAQTSAVLLEKVGKAHARSFCVKLVHDHLNEQGMQVRNSIGIEWMAYGDQGLERSPETVRLAQEAVRLSRQEVDDVAAGKIPDPNRSPLKLIPSEVGLGGKFVALVDFLKKDVFLNYLRPLLLTETKENKLYQLLKGGIPFAIAKGEHGAGQVGRSVGEASKSAAEKVPEGFQREGAGWID